MHSILFELGPITIYTYGFLVFLGVISSYCVCSNEAKRQGIDPNIFSNIFFWILLLGFLGARIFYILVSWEIFINNPLGLIFGRSGFVFYGGIIVGIICLYAVASMHNIEFLRLADIFALGIPLAHAFGRLGCFFYGCCYGRPSDAFFCIAFPPGSPAGLAGLKVIPTQPIASFFLFLIFCVLLFITYNKKYNGQIAFYYIGLYSTFRFVLEFFRGDPRGSVLFLSTSQFISLLAMISVALIYYCRKRCS